MNNKLNSLSTRRGDVTYLTHSYLITDLPQASFPCGPLCLQHPSVVHSDNSHGGALLPFEIFPLTTCRMTFSSSAFLTPSHGTTLPFSKHFPQGNTSRSALLWRLWYLPGFQSRLTWLDLQPPHRLPASPHWGTGERQHSKRGSDIWISTSAVPSLPFPDLPLWGTEGLISLYLSPEKASVCCPPTRTNQTGLLILVKRRPRKLERGYAANSNPDSSTSGSQIQSKIRPSGPPLIFPHLCSPSPPVTPKRLGQRCFEGDLTVTGTEPMCQH